MKTSKADLTKDTKLDVVNVDNPEEGKPEGKPDPGGKPPPKKKRKTDTGEPQEGEPGSAGGASLPQASDLDNLLAQARADLGGKKDD